MKATKTKPKTITIKNPERFTMLKKLSKLGEFILYGEKPIVEIVDMKAILK